MKAALACLILGLALTATPFAAGDASAAPYGYRTKQQALREGAVRPLPRMRRHRGARRNPYAEQRDDYCRTTPRAC